MANVKISDISVTATAIAAGDFIEGEAADGTSVKIPGSVLTETVRDVIAAALVAGANMTVTVSDAGDTITLASAGGGGGGAAPAKHPGYVPGQWYRCGPYQQLNVAAVANRANAIPFRVESDITITELGLYVVTAGGTQAKIAIYSNDAASKRPGTKLTEVTVPTTASAAATSAAVATPLVLTAGIYWAVVICDGTPTFVSTGTTDAILSHALGTSAIMNRIDNTYQATVNFADGLPGTFPAGVTSNGGCPIAFHKVS